MLAFPVEVAIWLQDHPGIDIEVIDNKRARRVRGAPPVLSLADIVWINDRSGAGGQPHQEGGAGLGKFDLDRKIVDYRHPRKLVRFAGHQLVGPYDISKERGRCQQTGVAARSRGIERASKGKRDIVRGDITSILETRVLAQRKGIGQPIVRNVDLCRPTRELVAGRHPGE